MRYLFLETKVLVILVTKKIDKDEAIKIARNIYTQNKGSVDLAFIKVDFGGNLGEIYFPEIDYY